jgi:hypothetical protein
MHVQFPRIVAVGMALAGVAAVSGVSAAPAGAASCAAPGSAHPETADGAACRLADELEKAFVIPDQGVAYARALRAHVAAGRYAGQSQEDAARMITSDLQAVAPDGHLRVELEANRRLPGGAAPGQKAPPVLEQAGWIAPGIAFLRINGFLPDDAQTAAVARFMEEHAEARAIIFDIRTHGGGGLAQMDVIFPWLFAEETRLVTMAMRRSVEEEHGTPFGEGSTLRKLAGTPQETVREHWAIPNADSRLRDAKVYLLTSQRTGSAAEHFALAMKHTGRAKLVGSNTAGANHFGGGIPLGGGFGAFMPVGRTYDPVTGKDWEGTGVLPDVDVPPAEALAWVLRDLGLESAKAAELAASHAPTLPMERRKA